MSGFYSAKRTRNLFEPGAGKPFKLSRSKLELFMSCPRCFYLDRRLGTGQPGGFPFNLNLAVDHLLKKEFDHYRAQKKAHPLMEAHGVDATPFSHAKLDDWRENFKGVEVHHAETNLIISGAIDDLWVNPKAEVIVVDYKATSKNGEIGIDAAWQQAYKRQIEIYQWLLRGNGLTVSDMGYFVYCNGRRDRAALDSRLEFDIHLIPYTGSDAWVEECIKAAHRCLMADDLPAASPDCDFCNYRSAVKDAEAESMGPGTFKSSRN